jgi:ABC-type antimicrobial peptide transport system permease subunit
MIVALVLREGLGLAFGGITLGIIAVLALRRVARLYMYGLAPADPWIMTLVAIMLASIGFIACAYPARRASRVDAIQILRA